MSLIYGQASTVVVWLGESFDGSDLAIDVLEHYEENNGLHLDPLILPSLVIETSHGYVEINTSIRKLLRVPWWQRLWTVQEFVLAQQVVFQCGKRLLKLDTLKKFEASFVKHLTSCCKRVRYENNMDRLWYCFETVATLIETITTRKTPADFGLLQFMSQFRNRESADPRDKVYGLLGLAFGEEVGFVEPDYTLSYEEVLQATVIASVNRTGTLQFLSHVYGPRDRHLPSFLPDWSMPIPDTDFHLDRRVLVSRYYPAKKDESSYNAS